MQIVKALVNVSLRVSKLFWKFKLLGICSNLPVKFAIFLKVAYFLTPKRDLGRFSVWKRLKYFINAVMSKAIVVFVFLLLKLLQSVYSQHVTET